jgi:hypothetical protein
MKITDVDLDLQERFTTSFCDYQKLIGNFQVMMSKKMDQFNDDPTEEKAKELNKICFILNCVYNQINKRKELGIQ